MTGQLQNIFQVVTKLKKNDWTTSHLFCQPSKSSPSG